MEGMHPEGARSIDAKVTALHSRVRRYTLRQREQSGFETEGVVAATITDTDFLNEPVMGFTDPYGRHVAKFFHKGEQTFGLADEGYDELKSLVALLQKNGEIHRRFSARFLKERLFFWCRVRAQNEFLSSLMEYLIAQASEVVRRHMAWVPMSSLPS
jgi:hypothetical protein